VSNQLDRELAWPPIGLVAASLIGTVIGTVAIPSAWSAILAMTLAQLAVTALGLLSSRRPVLWAFAIAAVSLGSVLLDSRLSELAYSGAIPWISLGTAMGALNLYRRAADWIAIWAGTTALILSSISLVVVSIQAGVPPTSAILSASVPFLLGIIIALLLHLRDARDDRLRRPELAITSHDPDDQATHGTFDATRRALAIVALRSDELVTSTEDVSARRAAADLRDLARRALTGPGSGQHSIARIELHPAASSTASELPPTNRAVMPMPDLPEREHEILRLVATGASNASIGRSLYLSEATVKQYVSKLMRKFDRDNRTQLALMAAHWFKGD
jgi:DNA-binding NarL/FixJ family response regulator